MFEPLFKTAEPPPPKGVSVEEWDKILSKGPSYMSKKTAAPIHLIRKLAAGEGVVKGEREKQVKKELDRASREQMQVSAPGAAIGMLGGGVLGGVAAHKLAPGSAPLGAYAGLVGGGVLGARLGGGARGKELSDQIGSLYDEQQALAAMRPGSVSPLSEENLDREGYHKARAENAQATLDLGEHMRPVRRAQLLGMAGGGALGASLAHKFMAPGTAGVLDRARVGGLGAIGGSLLGAGAGLALMDKNDRRALGKSFSRANKTQDKRDAIWQGAATLDKASSVPVELVRKVAQAVSFDELTQPPPPSTEEIMLQQKLACVEDEGLFKTAFFLADDTEDALRTYESLGGKYVIKHAFGQQMFDSRQMAGSPATAGGMSRRATTTMPAPQQASPVQSPATSSPKSQAQGASSAPSATSQTSTPAAAPSAAPVAPMV